MRHLSKLGKKGALVVLCPFFEKVRERVRYLSTSLAQAWLAQLGERQSAEREVAGSNPGRTNTQGLQITEKKVLPL